MRKSASAIVMAMLAVLAGCDKTPPTAKNTPKDGPQASGAAKSHDHPDAGPHGGHLIELGEEEFHAELVDDDKGGTVTIYLLDSKAKDSVAGDEDEVVINLVLEEKPRQFVLKSTSADKRDQFVSKDADLLKGLDAKKSNGKLNVKIKGKSYSGKLEHAGHSHKH